MFMLLVFGALCLHVALASTPEVVCRYQDENGNYLNAYKKPDPPGLKEYLDASHKMEICQDQQKNAFKFLGGIRINGNKLYISKGEQATYDEAVTKCRNDGGQIATPQNADEDQAVRSIVLQFNIASFLGINDRLKEGDFRDLNGAVPTYTDWASGQPNNLEDKEDCAVMLDSGYWDDFPCTSPQLVVCEFI